MKNLILLIPIGFVTCFLNSCGDKHNNLPETIQKFSQESHSDDYRQAAQLISDADVLFISAGAGMGVPGGLGTFRGSAAGVWPPLEKLGLKFQDMSNPDRFVETDQHGPELAWGFWRWRYNAYTGTEPHKGYQYLLDWSKSKKNPSFVFTSNIDGHFLRAGFERVQEVHGAVKHLQCIRTDKTCPYYNKLWLPEDNLIENLQVDPLTDKVTSPLPRCPGCARVARPAVFMFGDTSVLRTIIDRQGEDLQDWRNTSKLKNLRVVVIEIGAGIAIPTVRNKSESISREFSCPLIRINPENPQIKNAAPGIKHISMALGAEDALGRIDEQLKILALPQ